MTEENENETLGSIMKNRRLWEEERVSTKVK